LVPLIPDDSAVIEVVMTPVAIVVEFEVVIGSPLEFEVVRTLVAIVVVVVFSLHFPLEFVLVRMTMAVIVMVGDPFHSLDDFAEVEIVAHFLQLIAMIPVVVVIGFQLRFIISASSSLEYCGEVGFSFRFLEYAVGRFDKFGTFHVDSAVVDPLGR